jgi:hypothetical protein
LATVGLLGCGGSSAPPPGAETGPCYANATCNAGLTCLSEICDRVDADAGSTVTDAGADAGAGGDAFQPAPHPRLPQMANHGGPVLDAPKVQPILYAADSEGADLEDFLNQLARASYWHDTTAEYGVGPLQVLTPIMLATQAPATVTDDSIQSDLARNTTGANSIWGAADAQTAYLMIYPQGTLVTFSDGATCCQDFGGYHYETRAGTMSVPYAVACACPGSLGLNLTTLEERTMAISHELVETATSASATTA